MAETAEAGRVLQSLSVVLVANAVPLMEAFGLADRAARQLAWRMRAVAGNVKASAATMAMAAAGGAYVIARAFANAIAPVVQFEYNLAHAMTMLQGTGMVFQAWRRQMAQGVLDLAVQFGEGTRTLLKGLYDILSSLIPPADAMTTLAAAALAARAGFIETSLSAQLLTGILRSFGTEAGDVYDIVGKLFVAVRRGRFEFSELAQRLGRALPVWASAGLSLDELLATMMTLTRAGMRMSQAVTSTIQSVRNFMLPTRRAVAAVARWRGELAASGDVVRALAFDLDLATLRKQGYIKTIAQMNFLLPEEVAQFFSNIRALRAVSIMHRRYRDALEDLAAQQEAYNAVQEAANKALETTQVQMQRLSQAINALRVRALMPTNRFIGRIVGAIADVIAGFSRLPGIVNGTVAVFAGFVAVGLTAVGVIKMIATAFSILGVNVRVAASRLAVLGAMFAALHIVDYVGQLEGLNEQLKILLQGLVAAGSAAYTVRSALIMLGRGALGAKGALVAMAAIVTVTLIRMASWWLKNTEWGQTFGKFIVRLFRYIIPKPIRDFFGLIGRGLSAAWRAIKNFFSAATRATNEYRRSQELLRDATEALNDIERMRREGLITESDLTWQLIHALEVLKQHNYDAAKAVQELDQSTLSAIVRFRNLALTTRTARAELTKLREDFRTLGLELPSDVEAAAAGAVVALMRIQQVGRETADVIRQRLGAILEGFPERWREQGDSAQRAAQDVQSAMTRLTQRARRDVETLRQTILQALDMLQEELGQLPDNLQSLQQNFHQLSTMTDEDLRKYVVETLWYITENAEDVSENTRRTLTQLMYDISESSEVNLTQLAKFWQASRDEMVRSAAVGREGWQRFMDFLNAATMSSRDMFQTFASEIWNWVRMRFGKQIPDEWNALYARMLMTLQTSGEEAQDIVRGLYTQLHRDLGRLPLELETSLREFAFKTTYTSEQVRKWMIENVFPKIYDAYIKLGKQIPSTLQTAIESLAGMSLETLIAIERVRRGLKAVGETSRLAGDEVVELVKYLDALQSRFAREPSTVIEWYLRTFFPKFRQAMNALRKDAPEVAQQIERLNKSITGLSWEQLEAFVDFTIDIPRKTQLAVEQAVTHFRRIAEAKVPIDVLVQAYNKLVEALHKAGVTAETLRDTLRQLGLEHYYLIDQFLSMYDEALQRIGLENEQQLNESLQRLTEYYAQIEILANKYIEDEQLREQFLKYLLQKFSEDRVGIWEQYYDKQSELIQQSGKPFEQRVREELHVYRQYLEEKYANIQDEYTRELLVARDLKAKRIALYQDELKRVPQFYRRWLDLRLEMLKLQGASEEELHREKWQWILKYERTGLNALRYAWYRYASDAGDAFDILQNAAVRVLNTIERDVLRPMLERMLGLEEKMSKTQIELTRARMEDQKEQLLRQYEEGQISYERYLLEIRALDEQFAAETKGRYKNLKEVLTDVWTGVRRVAVDALINIVKTARWSSIKTAAQTLWSSIKQIWSHIYTAAAAVFKWLVTKLGPWGIAAGIASAAGLILLARKTFVEGLKSKVRGLQKGGVVLGETVATLGEKGPELVLPLRKVAGRLQLTGEALRELQPATTRAQEVNITFEGDVIDFSGSLPMIDDTAVVDRIYRNVWLPARKRRVAAVRQVLSKELMT